MAWKAKTSAHMTEDPCRQGLERKVQEMLQEHLHLNSIKHAARERREVEAFRTAETTPRVPNPTAQKDKAPYLAQGLVGREEEWGYASQKKEAEGAERDTPECYAEWPLRWRQAAGGGRRERKRRSGWRGRTAMLSGGEKGRSVCARTSGGSPGCASNWRSSRTQRARRASAASAIHCSSNTAISLRRLAVWFKRESSKLSSDVLDASCKKSHGGVMRRAVMLNNPLG